MRKGAKFPLTMLMQSYRVHFNSDGIYERKMREYSFHAIGSLYGLTWFISERHKFLSNYIALFTLCLRSESPKLV